MSAYSSKKFQFKFTSKLSNNLSSLQSSIICKSQNFLNQLAKLRNDQQDLSQFQISQSNQPKYQQIQTFQKPGQMFLQSNKSITQLQKSSNTYQNVYENPQVFYNSNQLNQKLMNQDIYQGDKKKNNQNIIYEYQKRLEQYADALTIMKQEVMRLNEIIFEKDEQLSEMRKNSYTNEKIMEYQKIIKQYERQTRCMEEKLFIYESIFVNINNLLIDQQKLLKIAPIEDLKNTQYDVLEEKLRKLFLLIEYNKQQKICLEAENDTIKKNLQNLSSEIQKINFYSIEKQLEDLLVHYNAEDLIFNDRNQFNSEIQKIINNFKGKISEKSQQIQNIKTTMLDYYNNIHINQWKSYIEELYHNEQQYYKICSRVLIEEKSEKSTANNQNQMILKVLNINTNMDSRQNSQMSQNDKQQRQNNRNMIQESRSQNDVLKKVKLNKNSKIVIDV